MTEDQRTDGERRMDIEQTWEWLINEACEGNSREVMEERCKALGMSADAIEAARLVHAEWGQLEDAEELLAETEEIRDRHKKQLAELQATHGHLIAHVQWTRDGEPQIVGEVG
jgi:hypothetical protein